MVASLHVVSNPDPLTGSRGFSPSSCSPGRTCGNGLEKIYPTCAVRYGYMSYIGEFRYAPGILFGGERIIFHFMSEERVDFRDLVRDLAHEYHTRIEMHQVGARDEARLVADYEICGRECCCKNFLKTLRPITMRMAKLQKATLDP